MMYYKDLCFVVALKCLTCIWRGDSEDSGRCTHNAGILGALSWNQRQLRTQISKIKAGKQNKKLQVGAKRTASFSLYFQRAPKSLLSGLTSIPVKD
jgi:hypothetical protein